VAIRVKVMIAGTVFTTLVDTVNPDYMTFMHGYREFVCFLPGKGMTWVIIPISGNKMIPGMPFARQGSADHGYMSAMRPGDGE
jgi:hypothetical protein